MTTQPRYRMRWEELASVAFLLTSSNARSLLSLERCKAQLDQLGAKVVKLEYAGGHVVIEAKLHCSSFQQADELKHSWMLAERLGTPLRVMKWNTIELVAKPPAGQYTVHWEIESAQSWCDGGAVTYNYDLVRDKLINPAYILAKVEEHPDRLTQWTLRRSFVRSNAAFKFYRELLDGEHGIYNKDSPTLA